MLALSIYLQAPCTSRDYKIRLDPFPSTYVVQVYVEPLSGVVKWVLTNLDHDRQWFNIHLYHAIVDIAVGLRVRRWNKPTKQTPGISYCNIYFLL